jgi:CBS domain-containing protein
MDISEIVSTKFTEVDIGTPLSKVAGAFENQELDAVVVTDGDEYRGIVSRRQLASSSNQPSAKSGSQVQHVPTVDRTEDVREVARLMIGSDAKTLPVLDNDRVVGVVTADAVLETVRPFLDAVTVDDAYTTELISVAPKTTLGEALNTLREARIAHLPVIDDEELVGILSLYDVIAFTTRGGNKSQGGSSGDFGESGRAAGEAMAASAHVRAIPTVCSICRCGT